MSTHLIRFVAGEMSANVVNHMEPMWSTGRWVGGGDIHCMWLLWYRV